MKGYPLEAMKLNTFGLNLVKCNFLISYSLVCSKGIENNWKNTLILVTISTKNTIEGIIKCKLMTSRSVGDGPWLSRNTSKCLITSVLGGKTKLAGDLSCLAYSRYSTTYHTTPTTAATLLLISPLHPMCCMTCWKLTTILLSTYYQSRKLYPNIMRRQYLYIVIVAIVVK